MTAPQRLRYRAVFTGDLQGGCSIETAARSLSRIGVAESAIAGLRRGAGAIVQDGLTVPEAASLQKAFAQAGADLRIERSTAVPAPPPPPPPLPPAPPDGKVGRAGLPAGTLTTRPVAVTRGSFASPLGRLRSALILAGAILAAASLLCSYLVIRRESVASVGRPQSARRPFGSGAPASGRPDRPTTGSGVFDPRRVYVLDHLSGTCTNRALFSPSAPHETAVGFPCDAEAFTIRPSDGRLLYIDVQTDEVRVFVPDPMVWDDAAKAWSMPSDPEANDPVIVHDSLCPEGVLSRLFVGQEEDSLVLGCEPARTPTYIDAGGRRVLPDGRALIAIGRKGLQLTIAGERRWTLVDNVGKETRITGLPAWLGRPAAVRAHGAGFRILTTRTIGSLEYPRELWSIDPDGRASKAGSYDIPPAGLQVGGALFGQLDSQGSLYETGHLLEASGVVPVVVRFPLDAAMETLVSVNRSPHDQLRESPLRLSPQLHMARGVTGP